MNDAVTEVMDNAVADVTNAVGDAVPTDVTEKIGFVERYLNELPQKALNLGIRVVLALVFFFVGVQVIKLIRRALENHRSAMIYFVIGMMIGSLYAIVMGPTTLENTKAAMTLHTFHPVFFIIGIVIVFGLEKIKAIAE